MMEKHQAVVMVSSLLRERSIPGCRGFRVGPEERVVSLNQADCIHLVWSLDNALQGLQITCTFQEKWLDVLGFPDLNGEPIPLEEPAKIEVIRLLNLVNGYAKFGCAFYLDDTSDIACAGRIPYSLLERAPDYAIEMIRTIWAFFCDIGDELIEVAEGRQAAEDAFQAILDNGWGTR